MRAPLRFVIVFAVDKSDEEPSASRPVARKTETAAAQRSKKIMTKENRQAKLQAADFLHTPTTKKRSLFERNATAVAAA